MVTGVDWVGRRDRSQVSHRSSAAQEMRPLQEAPGISDQGIQIGQSQISPISPRP